MSKHKPHKHETTNGQPQSAPSIQPNAAALMPQDAASRKILKERAALLALDLEHPQQTQALGQYLRFRLGAVERYGIPYHYLEKIVPVHHLACVPCTPDFIAGVINYCGELLTILDPKIFFGLPAIPLLADARIIIVKHEGQRVGLLVDDVESNESYSEQVLSAPIMSTKLMNMAYVLGIHAGNVTLLNIAAILNDKNLCVSHSNPSLSFV